MEQPIALIKGLLNTCGVDVHVAYNNDATYILVDDVVTIVRDLTNVTPQIQGNTVNILGTSMVVYTVDDAVDALSTALSKTACKVFVKRIDNLERVAHYIGRVMILGLRVDVYADMDLYNGGSGDVSGDGNSSSSESNYTHPYYIWDVYVKIKNDNTHHKHIMQTFGNDETKTRNLIRLEQPNSMFTEDVRNAINYWISSGVLVKGDYVSRYTHTDGTYHDLYVADGQKYLSVSIGIREDTTSLQAVILHNKSTGVNVPCINAAEFAGKYLKHTEALM